MTAKEVFTHIIVHGYAPGKHPEKDKSDGSVLGKWAQQIHQDNGNRYNVDPVIRKSAYGNG